MVRSKLVVAVVAMALAVAGSGCATLVRSSVGANGTQANAQSVVARGHAISDKGRYVAFDSTASNLVPGDTNDAADVFRHDNATGETVRVSVHPDGAEINGESFALAISGDGQHVVFGTQQALDATDSNSTVDVYVRSVAAGTTERASIRPDGSPVNYFMNPHQLITAVSVSDDGRYVAIVHSMPQVGELFIRDLASDTTVLVGNQADHALLSGDATHYVENQLCSGGPCPHRSFIASLEGGSFQVIDSECGFTALDISGDARFVVGERFGVYPTFTCPEPTGLVRYDRTTQQFKKVPLDSWTVTGTNAAGVQIADSGRFVAALDEEGFVKIADLVSGDVSTADTDAFGNSGPGRTGSFSLSGSGRYVAFTTLSPLTRDDDNQVDDVFTRYAVQPRVSDVSPGTLGAGAQHASLRITGAQLLPGATVAVGPGVTVHSVTVDSPTRLTVDVSVAADADTGPREVVVSNTGGFGHADGLCPGCLTID